jgi:hypothetical protein
MASTSSQSWRCNPPTNYSQYSWHQIAYVIKKLQYWLYVRRNLTRARKYGHRLRRLLSEQGCPSYPVCGQIGFSLCAEVEGDLARAAAHRRRAMRKYARLLAIAQSMDIARYCMQDFQWPVYGRLAEIYLQLRQPRRALEVLEAARGMCESIGMPFQARRQLNALQRARAKSHTG